MTIESIKTDTNAMSPDHVSQPKRLRAGEKAECDGLWFDIEGGISKLRISPALPCREREFYAQVEIGGDTLIFQFSFVAVIKGQQVYEATRLHRGDVQGLSVEGRLFRLSGPFQGARKDAV